MAVRLIQISAARTLCTIPNMENMSRGSSSTQFREPKMGKSNTKNTSVGENPQSLFLVPSCLDSTIDKTLNQYHKDHVFYLIFFVSLFLCFIFSSLFMLYFPKSKLSSNYLRKMAMVSHTSCLPAIVNQMSYKYRKTKISLQ